MFGKILKKFNKVVDDTEQIEDRFYAEVMDELSQGFKDKAATGKAIAQCDGDESKFNSIYIKVRAQALQNIYIEEEQIKQMEQQIENKKRESLEKLIIKRFDNGYFADLFKDEIKRQGYTFTIFRNTFNKNGRAYHGKIDYENMKYLLVNDDNEYKDSFPFKLKE